MKKLELSRGQLVYLGFLGGVLYMELLRRWLARQAHRELADARMRRIEEGLAELSVAIGDLEAAAKRREVEQ